jgi:hypothetical protein
MTDEHQYCQECGADLYGESHILLETKVLLDELIDGMDTTCVGRPIFALIIGDSGTDWKTSDTLNVDEEEELDLFISCLEEVIKAYKVKEE